MQGDGAGKLLYEVRGACKDEFSGILRATSVRQRIGRVNLKVFKISRRTGVNRYEQGIKLGASLTMAAAICTAVAILPCAAQAWSGNAPMRFAAEPPAAAPPDDAATDDDKDVSNSQVEKYIDAYKAMQKDHSLTAEQAASKEGLTIAQFRSLEGRIERDDTLRERVRKALRTANNPAAKDSSD
jgi:hypothetical protein